jgi:hypothetical protein
LLNENTIHLYPSFVIVKRWIGVLLNPHMHTFCIIFVENSSSTS